MFFDMIQNKIRGAYMKINIKYLLRFIAIAFFFIAVCLFLPVIQNFLIFLAENILSRSLRRPEKWIGYMKWLSVLFFSLSFLTYAVSFEHIVKFVLSFVEKHSVSLIKVFCVTSVVIVFCAFVLPFIIFGENSVLTIHDNLDCGPNIWIYLNINNSFWKLDYKTTVLDNVSTLYLNRDGYTLYNMLLCLLPTFWGYVLNYFVCVLFGFISMFFLLKFIFHEQGYILTTLVSLAYATLPAVAVYRMGCATLPFIILMFCLLVKSKNPMLYLGVFFFPFVSEISSVGIFVCGFWFLGIIAVSIYEKKFALRLLVAFGIMCASMLIVNFRLLYMRFYVHEALNRDFFTISAQPFLQMFKTFFVDGYYHAPTFQNKVINRAVLIGLVLFVVKYFIDNKNCKNNTVPFAMKILFYSVLFSLVCSVFAALSEASLLQIVTSKILPFLKGVSLTRIYVIARVAVYIAFASTLVYLCQYRYGKVLATFIACLQIFVIFKWSHSYNDSLASWKRNLTTSGKENYITYKEFYSERQFDEIKQYINYNGENVAAYGYHPSVLMYNGFNCIDGYISVYPYKDMQKFRTLIAPTLDKNEEARQYYDSWGGRRYLYSIFDRKNGLPDIYSSTREKHIEPIPLYINPNVFKSDYVGKYILSSYPISNADDMNLQLVKSFDSNDSIYIIYVYEMM